MTDINNTINVPQPGSPRFQSDTAKAIGRIRASLGGEGRPYFQTLTLGGLTASRLVYGDTDKTLQSVTDLTTWVAGTANEVTVADDGDGTITIGLSDPVIVGKGGTGAATLTDHSILLGSGTDPITSLGAATNGQLPIGSTGADPVLATLTGTANQVIVANGAGTITLSGPQDIHTGATPTFVGVELDDSTELRFETSLLVGGITLRSYRDTVDFGSSYMNFYRARGNSLAAIATVVDGDWATKWRMYGWTGAAYDQFGGFLYNMYDVASGYGKFVFYHQTGSANYIAEIGAEYSRFGDTDGTDYVQIGSTDGKVLFKGSNSGLAYGSMYSISDMAVTMTTQNVWKEIDVATAWVAGKLNNCTFTDPYLVATNAGTYLITWNIVARIGTANQLVEVGVMIDQTVTDNPAHGLAGVQGEGRGAVEYLNSARRLGTSGSAIITLVAGQKVSLAVRNITSDAKVLTVSKGNLKITQIGG